MIKEYDKMCVTHNSLGKTNVSIKTIPNPKRQIHKASFIDVLRKKKL